MKNPKTTIAGYLVLLASLTTAAAHFFTGALTSADLGLVLSGIAGIGLIGSADGGH